MNHFTNTLRYRQSELRANLTDIDAPPIFVRVLNRVHESSLRRGYRKLGPEGLDIPQHPDVIQCAFVCGEESGTDPFDVPSGRRVAEKLTGVQTGESHLCRRAVSFGEREIDFVPEPLIERLNEFTNRHAQSSHSTNSAGLPLLYLDNLIAELAMPSSHTSCMGNSESLLDPVPEGIGLTLDETFRVLEAIEDARLELAERSAAPGLQDELATVIRMLHGKLGLDEGGMR